MSTSAELISRVALSFISGIRIEVGKALDEAGLTPEEFLNTAEARRIVARGLRRRQPITSRDCDLALEAAEKEVDFAQRHHIRVLYYSDPDYPTRLAVCDGAPLVVYALGNCDLNAPHSVAMVGTRRPSAYGVKYCGEEVAQLHSISPEALVVSGLAHGIDAVAHRKALELGMKTVAVVAHGLDTIYPAQHRQLAADIIKQGGAILTQYPQGTQPYRGHFLERNRVIAAITDAVVVIESEIKGGAMSTAAHARDLDRPVYALPGRISDPLSSGCNNLIAKDRATLLVDMHTFAQQMGWRVNERTERPSEPALFPEMDERYRRVWELVHQEGPMAVDVIYERLGGNIQQLTALLSEMEFIELLTKLPGNRYEVI